MTNAPQPDELNRPIDPAQLGADQGPGSAPEDNPQDMSPVMTTADKDRDRENPGSQATGLGSAFDQQRRQAAGSDDRYGAFGHGQGMGRTGENGDLDRGYDQSGHRGGLGTSGGHEDLSDRHIDAAGNPFAGGYGGGDYGQPDESQRQHLGMNSRNPADEAASAPDETADTSGS